MRVERILSVFGAEGCHCRNEVRLPFFCDVQFLVPAVIRWV